MGWNPPQHWTELQSLLKKTMQVKLDSGGNGVIIFDPDNAHQRWIVESVVVTTNQAATATTIPICTIALNTTAAATLSPGNQYGTSWSGNNDSFQGSIDVGSGDFLSILFQPPPGATAAQIATLSGVLATAIVTGSKFTRRA